MRLGEVATRRGGWGEARQGRWVAWAIGEAVVRGEGCVSVELAGTWEGRVMLLLASWA